MAGTHEVARACWKANTIAIFCAAPEFHGSLSHATQVATIKATAESYGLSHCITAIKADATKAVRGWASTDDEMPAFEGAALPPASGVFLVINSVVAAMAPLNSQPSALHAGAGF